MPKASLRRSKTWGKANVPPHGRTSAVCSCTRSNRSSSRNGTVIETHQLAQSRSAPWAHLSRLLLHKIKQVLQPERDCASWWVSITSSRQAIRRLIQSSPSLRPYIQQNLQEIYQDALELALIETGLEHAAVPAECPWDLDTLLHGETAFFLVRMIGLEPTRTGRAH